MCEQNDFVTTTFSPFRSLVFNHAVFQIDGLLRVQRDVISTRQLLGGRQASAAMMCKAAERLLSLKCQNDSPPHVMTSALWGDKAQHG